MGYMSIVTILSILISTLMSVLVLTKYIFNNKISISIIITLLVTNIVGPIICVISLFLMGIITNILDIRTMMVIDKLYALGYNLCIYISPFYAYCLNKKKSKKYFWFVTILFIIILTMIFTRFEVIGDKFNILGKIQIYE